MKPDLQELYRQKEQAKIEKMAEIDEAGKIIRRALDALNSAIVEHKDIQTIAQVARECLSELRRMLKASDFKTFVIALERFTEQTNKKETKRRRGIIRK